MRMSIFVFHFLSEDHSDAPLDDRESKDEESMDETFARSREWCRIDLNNVQVRHPWFEFKGSSGLAFTVSSPPQPLELFEAYFDDLLDVIVADPNWYAPQFF